MPKPFVGFNACLAMMRQNDPQIREDGFHYLLPFAAEHLSQLIAEFHHEANQGMRWWLIELVGEAKSPDAFSFLAEHLTDEDEAVRKRALRGLEKLDTKAARTFLWERRFDLPEEI